MNKIYEIQFNENMNYIDTIKNIKLLGNFSIFNEFFYLNTDSELDKIKITLKNILKIKGINKKNYSTIPNDYCKNWCYDRLLKIELQEFEKSNQDYLKKVNKELDFFLELKEQGKLDEYIKTELEKVLKTKSTGGDKIDRREEIGETTERK